VIFFIFLRFLCLSRCESGEVGRSAPFRLRSEDPRARPSSNDSDEPGEATESRETKAADFGRGELHELGGGSLLDIELYSAAPEAAKLTLVGVFVLVETVDAGDFGLRNCPLLLRKLMPVARPRRLPSGGVGEPLPTIFSELSAPLKREECVRDDRPLLGRRRRARR